MGIHKIKFVQSLLLQFRACGFGGKRHTSTKITTKRAGGHRRTSARTMTADAVGYGWHLSTPSVASAAVESVSGEQGTP